MTAESGWTQGYVTDVSYTNSFFRELTPAWLNHVATIKGCHPRRLDNGFAHIDLGCGLGQSSIVLAGAHPHGRFFGVDFNPAHVAHAQRAAAELKLGNVTFLDRSFAELENADLPDFDFITLHGIYSWVGVEARRAIQRFIYRKLKPGGITYVSYNCLPGWAPDTPIRRLLYEFGAVHQGDSGKRAEQAAKDAKQLAELKQGYFRANPNAVTQVENLTTRQSNYLAHEYLNADWDPFYSVDVAEDMAAAKLSYVGSATLNENYLELMLADESAALCRKQPTERLRQLVLDYLIGQRFRRDVFVRGHAQLSAVEIAQNTRRLRFALPGPIEDFTAKTKVPRGEITFDSKIVAGVGELLANGPHSLEEIAQATAGKLRKGTELERTCLLMVAVGKLAPAAQTFDRKPAPAKPTGGHILSDANRKLAGEGRRTMQRQYLISEAIGSGISVDAVECLALLLLDEGVSIEKLAAVAGDELRKRGIRVNRDNVPITDPKESDARVDELIGKFVSRMLPTLSRAGAVELT